ncbi:cytochrome d ubiquinol oxidase subunit II [Bacillus carboniphilus]|uniref:Cytochrome d ubiquinol oxidase subunit II n=1 Tax=Bacillus carboniphilus TaxID=86663 RepID=A0ABY9JQV2_9BACI|nr:cytochrome d ubiquinol oxidase subunit II [Bacillus carboniphilus]WLR41189.1 cytochrome d ubiquinol oxidase subunit II [Bacillus carboniphilus]
MTSDELLAISIVWGFIFIYSVMATMDFGAGFWSMLYVNKRNTKASSIANRYLSPTWEVTNVFIVAIVVALITFFPGAIYTLGSVLLIPGSIILILLAIRSGFLAFSHSVKGYERLLVIISGVSGFIIPALLILVLPITHGGFVDNRNGVPYLSFSELLTSLSSYAFIAFAISSTLFLSALLLADYSNVAKEEDAYLSYRKDAIITGPISFFSALLIMLTIKQDANWLYEGMVQDVHLLILSVLLFLGAGLALFIPKRSQKGRPRLAIILITIQYFLASYVYGKAHLPYLIYPTITINDAFTHPNTFKALFITYIFAFLILFPGFYYFWKIFMKDQKYVEGKKVSSDNKH